MKGRLIVLEGIDGCGKTTQINHLAKWLPTSGLLPKGKKLLITKEPGGTALGHALRQLLLNNSAEANPHPLTELLLYAADRAQHISQLIRPAIERGDWVISDRFSSSTIAYQGYGRELSINLIKQLESIATEGLIADITLLLDISIAKSMARREEKLDDRIEAEGKDFLYKVANGFQQLAKQDNWIQINAEKSPSSVSSTIEETLKQYFQNLEDL